MPLKPAMPTLLRHRLRAVSARANCFARVTRYSLTQRSSSQSPWYTGPTTQFRSAMSTSPKAKTGDNDWSPDQYLLFSNARNRPIHDLIAFLGPGYAPARIVDLGCGPGNSTELLAARFPNAAITGMDSSPAMLAKARRTLPNTTFTLADVRSYTPPTTTDLLFANAVFHWLRHPERIPTITRLLLTTTTPGQKSEGGGTGGGVLAFQVPDNYTEPSHLAMRETAASAGPWQPYFDALAPDEQRPDLDPIESYLDYYNALKPHCRAVETWTTRYVHVLDDGHDGIVEWVKGTGLQPFVNVLPAEGGVREAFVEAYRKRLGEVYPLAEDGKVLLVYPRRFVVAFR